MRILFINRSYWPDAEATGQLLTELCEQIATEEEIQVSVICGQPNVNLEGTEFKPAGTTQRHGVEIHRVRHTRFDKSKFLGRVVNFITFLIAATWKSLWCRRPDIIVVETDPPLLCLLGYAVSILRGTKLVCYLQDVYPDIAIELGRLRHNFFTRVLRYCFLTAYRRADRVVVVGTDMRNWLVNHRVATERVMIIENWVDTNHIVPVKVDNKFSYRFDLEDKFVVMYSGNVGYTQRFDLVLDAAHQLRKNRAIVFAIIGGGVKRQWLSEQVIERGLPNVRFMNYQKKSHLSQSLSAADLHLVLLDSKLTQFMLPSKIYSAFASGTPVLGIGASETAMQGKFRTSHLPEMIDSNDAGFFVDEKNPLEIAKRIEWLWQNRDEARQMGRNARLAAVHKYSRDTAVLQFSNLFRELMGQPIRTISPQLAIDGETNLVTIDQESDSSWSAPSNRRNTSNHA